jgi:hypothetical protein
MQRQEQENEERLREKYRGNFHTLMNLQREQSQKNSLKKVFNHIETREGVTADPATSNIPAVAPSEESKVRNFYFQLRS